MSRTEEWHRTKHKNTVGGDAYMQMAAKVHSLCCRSKFEGKHKFEYFHQNLLKLEGWLVVGWRWLRSPKSKQIQDSFQCWSWLWKQGSTPYVCKEI